MCLCALERETETARDRVKAGDEETSVRKSTEFRLLVGHEKETNFFPCH